jgi:Cu/Ag efflux protein CusF
MTRASLFAGALLAVVLPALPGRAAEVRGVISKVNADKHELLLEGKSRGFRGTTVRFAVDADTKVRFGDEDGKLGDLDVGRRVVVTFDEQDGKKTALVIRAFGAKPEGKTVGAVAGDGGVVRLVSLTEREIVVTSGPESGGEKETVYSIPKDAKIVRNDKAITLDEIKEGEKVTVEADRRDGKEVARTVYVGAAPVAKKADRKAELMKWAQRFMQMTEQMRKDR